MHFIFALQKVIKPEEIMVQEILIWLLIIAPQTGSPGQNWWLAACLFTLAERIATFSFLIPTAISLMRTCALSDERARQTGGYMDNNELSAQCAQFYRPAAAMKVHSLQ